MENAYITAMLDSLNDKIDILNEIHLKDEEQLKLINEGIISDEAYDRLDDEKSVLIYKLNKLDDGFQLVYDKVKEELDRNRTKYSSEISLMKERITKITELSTKIQAEEARNKAALENYFKGKHAEIKGSRSQVKAIRSYTQTMINGRSYNGFPTVKK